jgi:hypothetical protein
MISLLTIPRRIRETIGAITYGQRMAVLNPEKARDMGKAAMLAVMDIWRRS